MGEQRAQCLSSREESEQINREMNHRFGLTWSVWQINHAGLACDISLVENLAKILWLRFSAHDRTTQY